jgi:hypothetical protein
MRDNDSLILESLYHTILENSGLDAKYAELERRAKTGDKEAEAEAQRMVDEAAKTVGYNVKTLHGTSGEWSVFDLNKIGTIQRQDFGKGIYLTPLSRKKDAEMYARRSSEQTGLPAKVLQFFVKISNPLIGQNYAEEGSDLTGAARERGRDGVIIKYDLGEDRIGMTVEMIALNPNQIKSADPFTYDDNGELIPLSQRFDSSNDDIRY